LILSIAIPLIVLAASGFTLVRFWKERTSNWEAFGVFIAGIGIIGFLAPFFMIQLTWAVPSSWELPNALGSNAIRLPGANIAVANVPMQRIQIYGPDGVFQRGFAVDSRGKDILLEAAQDNAFRICPFATKQGYIIDPGSGTIRQDGECSYSSQPYQTISVSQGLLAWFLLPLWHPLVAWVMGLIGFLLNARHF
jgi:hypothetical protein